MSVSFPKSIELVEAGGPVSVSAPKSMELLCALTTTADRSSEVMTERILGSGCNRTQLLEGASDGK